MGNSNYDYIGNEVSVTPTIVIDPRYLFSGLLLYRPSNLLPSSCIAGPDPDSAPTNDMHVSKTSLTELQPVVAEEPRYGHVSDRHLSKSCVLSLSLTTSAEPARLTCWEHALAGLKPEYRTVLDDFSAGDIGIFETEIERVRALGDSCSNKLSKGPKGTHIMTRGRVHGILQKMEEFAKIGDIIVTKCPEVVSLVWTGVRL